MPRGVYDRSHAKIARLEKALHDEQQKTRRIGAELERARVQAPSAEGLADVGNFETLRRNLEALAAAREKLTAGDVPPADVIQQLDVEIEMNIRAITELRKSSFRMKDEGQPAKLSTVRRAQKGVPLPMPTQPPQFQAPPPPPPPAQFPIPPFPYQQRSG